MKFRGIKFLIFITVLYAVLFIIDSSNALLALQESGKIIKKIAPIFMLRTGKRESTHL